MTRIALVTLAAAAVAAVTSASAWAQAPIQIRTSLTPDWIYFADHITARLDVVVDRARVDTGSIEVQTSFGPWEQVGGTVTKVEDTGTVAHRTTTFTLRCIAFDCLPKGTVVQRFHLPVVTVTAQSNDGASLVVKRPWPPVNVAGRFLPPPSGAFRPTPVLDLKAPPLRYSVDPGVTALAFDIAAGLAGLVAAVLGLVEVRRFVERRRHPVDDRPPLVRALSLVREAQSRDVEDRRRAVAHLARLLPEPTASETTAAELAWSRQEPSPVALEDLADTVEAAIPESK